MRHNLPKHYLRTLYFTFIFINNIYYCAEVYGNATASYLQPLQIAQNKALRTLHFKDRYFPSNEMHKECQIHKVNDVLEYKLSKLIHSLLRCICRLPEVLHKLIIPTYMIHNRNTRNNHQIYRGACEVLNYRITVDFFENYRDTVITFLYKYRHHSIFYPKLYFPVTVG